MPSDPSKFLVELPSELIPILDKLGVGQTNDERVIISIAIGLYAGHVVSLARAAEIAGKTIHQFIDILRQWNISWIHYDDAEFADDAGFVKNFTSDSVHKHHEGSSV